MKQYLLKILIVSTFIAPIGAMEEREHAVSAEEEQKSVARSLSDQSTYRYTHDEGYTAIILGKGAIQKQQFTQGSSSAIVCPSVPDLMAVTREFNADMCKITGEVSADICQAAGQQELAEECGKILLSDCPLLHKKVRCPVGQACWTDGCKLKVSNNISGIIHVVGPDCAKYEQKRQKEKLLADAYDSTLECAKKHNITHLALPLIQRPFIDVDSTIKRYPVRDASCIALKSIIRFVQNNPGQFKEIRLVFAQDKDEESHRVYGELLTSISEPSHTTASNIDVTKLCWLEQSVWSKSKCLWSDYKNQLILGGSGAVVAMVAAWLWWHKK